MVPKAIYLQLKFILIAIALVNVTSCNSSSINEDGCVTNNITKGNIDFDPDIWINIGCKKGSHYYTGSSDHPWKSLDGNGNAIMASGEIVNEDYNFTDLRKYTFSKIHSLSVSGSGKVNFNNLLRATLKDKYNQLIEDEFEVKLIRLLGTATFSHEVAIFLKDDNARWALSCKSYCNDDAPTVFMIQDSR